MRKAGIHLLAAATLTASCGSSPTTAPTSGMVAVSGMAIAFTTGLGVPGLTVAYGGTTTLTDSAGRYTLSVAIGPYQPLVEGVWMGESRVTGSTYRGDLLVLGGTCVSRYGTVADAVTAKPVARATVKFRGPGISDGTVSGPDGWYRIDLGCPANATIGINTTDLVATSAGYADASAPVGRGVGGVSRLDFALQPQ